MFRLQLMRAGNSCPLQMHSTFFSTPIWGLMLTNELPVITAPSEHKNTWVISSQFTDQSLILSVQYLSPHSPHHDTVSYIVWATVDRWVGGWVGGMACKWHSKLVPVGLSTPEWAVCLPAVNGKPCSWCHYTAISYKLTARAVSEAPSPQLLHLSFASKPLCV